MINLENFLMTRFLNFEKIQFLEEIKIIRTTKRIKTLSVVIRNGKCEIKCPYFTTDKFLRKLLKKKETWIEIKIKESLMNAEKIRKFGKNYICYQGKKITLVDKVSNQKKIIKTKNRLEIFYDSQKSAVRKNLIINWLKSEAKSYLSKRIIFLSNKIDIKYKSVFIKSYRSRWGCCSSKGEIFLNWKLIMLPKQVIDYVIIHELAHIIFPNHSKYFWELVEKKCPNYTKSKEWLSKNGQVSISIQ